MMLCRKKEEEFNLLILADMQGTIKHTVNTIMIFLANVNKDISSSLNFKALLGTNLRNDYFNSIYATTNGGLIIPGIYSLANSVKPY